MRILRNRRQAGEWGQVHSASSTSCSSSSCESPTEPAFRHVNRHCTGFHVWRVEHLQVVTVSRDQWGTFHDGDCYLVFASTERDQPVGPAGPHTRVREIRNGQLDQHVHVWVGGAAGPDESGAAAYKASELDEALGGRCVLRRELQGHESTRFLGYFKHAGIRVLKGSVSSVLPGLPTVRLFRVSGRPGRRCPVVTELPSVAWRHFSSGALFVVVTPHALVLWMGRYAGAAERLQAARVATAMRGEADGQADGQRALFLVEEGREVLLPPEKFALLAEALDPRRAALEVHHAPPPSHGAHGLDAGDLERTTDRPRLTLYHCADKDDTCMVTEVKNGPLDHSDLSHSDSYIVDHGALGVWVWLGRLVGERDRVEAMRNAQGFVRKKGYPASTAIARVTDGCEPAEFRCLFRTWHQATPVAGKKAGTTVHTRLDALALRESPRLAAELRLLDDGSGESRLWRVARAGLVGVSARRFGRLHSGECYVLHYRYGLQHAVFYWLGRTSSGERQSTAALWALEKSREIADETGVEAAVIRVHEGKEPPSMRALFRGRLVVLSGEAPPCDDGSSGLPASFLLRVDGSQNYDTRSVQVPRRVSSLRTSSVFVLRSKRGGWYLWCGRSSTGDEREMAKRVAIAAGASDLAVVYEGQEKDDFWTALGGSALAVEEYAPDADKDGDSEGVERRDPRPARLFACLGASTAAFAVEELPNVSQQELCPEEILILDARDTIFVWIGRHTSREARQKSTTLAIEFLKTDPASRELDPPIILLRQSHEPPMFTGFFSSWDVNMWDDYQSFDEVRAHLEGRPIPLSHQSSSDLPCIREFDDQDKFPLQLLLDPDISHLPHTVDVFRKELHLTHSDFVSVFGMDYPTFAQLPLWRQQSLKKTAGLF